MRCRIFIGQDWVQSIRWDKRPVERILVAIMLAPGRDWVGLRSQLVGRRVFEVTHLWQALPLAPSMSWLRASHHTQHISDGSVTCCLLFAHAPRTMVYRTTNRVHLSVGVLLGKRVASGCFCPGSYAAFLLRVLLREAEILSGLDSTVRASVSSVCVSMEYRYGMYGTSFVRSKVSCP